MSSIMDQPHMAQASWQNLWLPSLDDQWYGVAIEICIFVYCFVGLARVCDHYLVPSLEALCVRWNIQEDVAGASFMAFGSAAPEIIVNAIATIKADGTSDLGVGAIIGSGMIAFTVIPGCCAVFGFSAPLIEEVDEENHVVAVNPSVDGITLSPDRSRELRNLSQEGLLLKRRPVARDVFFYATSLAMLCCFFHDGVIYTWEAALLVLWYGVFLSVLYFAPKVRQWHRQRRYLSLHSLIERAPTRVTATDAGDGTTEKCSLVHHGHHHTNGASSSSLTVSTTPTASASSSSTAAIPTDASSSTSSTPSVTPSTSKGGHAPLVKQKSFVLQEKERRELAAKRVADKKKAKYQQQQQAAGNSVTVPVNGNGDSTPTANYGSTASTTPSSSSSAAPTPRPTHPIVETSDEDESAVLLDDTYVDVDEIDARGPIPRAVVFLSRPLELLFGSTIPPCEVGQDNESSYPFTFIMSFIWVSLFSFTISVVVERWVALSGVSLSLLGLALVAIGAEIPDTVQSVTVARKGYGSMAVANSSGSQITNILVGLGVPWLIANLMRPGQPVLVPDHINISIAAMFQSCNLILYASLLLGHAAYTNSPKAVLTPLKGKIFLCAYIVCLLGYTYIAASRLE